VIASELHDPLAVGDAKRRRRLLVVVREDHARAEQRGADTHARQLCEDRATGAMCVMRIYVLC
jgi:hypothetical protein